MLIAAIDALQVSWEYNLDLEMDKYARGIKYVSHQPLKRNIH